MEQLVAMIDCVKLGCIPRELKKQKQCKLDKEQTQADWALTHFPDSSDKRFIATLRNFVGKCALWYVSSCKKGPGHNTHSVWLLSMASQTKQLLISEKAVEASGPFIRVLQSNRLCVNPCNTLGQRKDGFHHLGRAAQLHIDMATAHAWGAAKIIVAINAIHDVLGILLRWILNKAVHCFSSRSLHDDMDGRTLSRGHGAITPSKESRDFLASDGIWDLMMIVSQVGLTVMKHQRETPTFEIIKTPVRVGMCTSVTLATGSEPFESKDSMEMCSRR